jgi:hypothetical protein
VVWVVAASVSPLLMNAMGWDLYRWGALTVLLSFLTLMTVERAEGVYDVAPETEGFRRSATALVMLNLASGAGYFLDMFPFSSLTGVWMWYLLHHGLATPPQ